MDTNPRLLVVDDEEPICRSCERIFQAQGFQVTSVTDPVVGLALAVRERFDTILLDMRMPRMDGMRFLQQLREQGSDAPVIVITGYASVDTAARFMRLGAVDYVAKPFTPAEISAAVGRLLSRPEPASSAPTPDVAAAGEDLLFFRRSWLRVAVDGSVLVGAWLDRSLRAPRGVLSMAQPGERLERGLPWASVILADGRSLGLPSPVDGVVVESREAGGWEQGALGRWLLRVRPFSLAADLERLDAREATVLHRDPVETDRLVGALAEQGFEVNTDTDPAEAFAALEEGEHLLVIDAGSATPGQLAERGPLPEGVVAVVVGATEIGQRLAWRLAGAHDVLASLRDEDIESLTAASMLAGERAAVAPACDLAAGERLGHLVLGRPGGELVSCWIEGGCVAAEGNLGRALREILGQKRPLGVHRCAAPLEPRALHGARPVVLRCDPALRPGAVVQRGLGAPHDELSGQPQREVQVLVVGSMVTGGMLELDTATARTLALRVRDLLLG